MEDLISIIIPVYNSAKYLPKCLDSVIGQTYRKLEIITINDGSIDNSLDILKEFEKKDNRIIILNKKNAGVSEARNDGIDAAKGEYIMFIDSDDWIEDNYIELLYEEMKDNQLDVCRTGFIVDRSGIPCEKISLTEKNELLINGNDIKQNFIDTTIFHSACVQLIKLDLIKKHNIRFDQYVAYEEDLLFNMNLYKYAKSIKYIDCSQYHYTANENSVTRQLNNVVKIISSIMLVNKKMINLVNNEQLAILINTKHLKVIIMYLWLLLRKNLKCFFSTCQKIDHNEFKKMINNYDIKTEKLKQKIKIIIVIKLYKISVKKYY